MNGYQVLQAMKSDSILRNIPVIMFSIIDETDSIVRCIQMGADDYLTKPFNQVILKARIHASLEKKRLRDRVERLATIGEAIAGMAHCIKNILNGINAGSYLLESQIAMLGSSVISDGWKIAKRNIRLLSDLILDILAYSKDRKPIVQPCTRKPIVQPCTLKDICDDVLSIIRDQARDNNIQLEFSEDIRAPKIVLLDEAAIRRCLINLVGNALDACAHQQNARVILTIEGEQQAGAGGFCLRVTDNGCGIAAHILPKLFTPFFSTKGNRGTGLGLAVTRKLVQEQGGEIQVYSEIGNGTSFVIIFPASKPTSTEIGISK